MAQSNNEYTLLGIGLLEGSITTERQKRALKEIRSHAKILVAMGICACFGGIQSMKLGEGGWKKRFQKVYGDEDKLFKTMKPFLIGMQLSGEEYKEVIQERVVPYSFVKRSRYNGESFIGRAIARINLLGERASEIQIFSQSTFLPCRISTNKVPFELLSALLGKEGKTSYLLGIQPSTLDFDSKISDEVKKSLEKVVEIFTPFFNHSERG